MADVRKNGTGFWSVFQSGTDFFLVGLPVSVTNLERVLFYYQFWYQQVIGVAVTFCLSSGCKYFVNIILFSKLFNYFFITY